MSQQDEVDASDSANVRDGLLGASRNIAADEDNEGDRWSAFLQKSKVKAWHIAGITADIATIAAMVCIVCERCGVRMTGGRWTVLQFFLAYAAFGQSVGCVAFLRFTPRAYLLLRATRHAAIRLAYLLAGVMPLFVGFAHLFTIAFGSESSGEFETFGRSLLALVFMMFGDNLLPAFRLIDGSRYWWMRAAADFIGCLYVAVFMSIVLNLIISVVVDTYVTFVRDSKVLTVLVSDSDTEEGDDGAPDQQAKVAREAALWSELRSEVIELTRQAAIVEKRRNRRQSRRETAAVSTGSQ